jgi:hypothetical protein
MLIWFNYPVWTFPYPSMVTIFDGQYMCLPKALRHPKTPTFKQSNLHSCVLRGKTLTPGTYQVGHKTTVFPLCHEQADIAVPKTNHTGL